MQISLELPEDIAKRLEVVWHDVSRGTLEALAVEGYLAYTEEDFEQDRGDLDRLMLR
jgi:hypothetical protein